MIRDADVRIADLREAQVFDVDWTHTNLDKVVWTDDDLWDDSRWR
jgi:hypothetical protein